MRFTSSRRRTASALVALSLCAAACGGSSNSSAPATQAAPETDVAETDAPPSEPAVTDATETDAESDQPAATEPATTEPPVTEPPVTEPPETTAPPLAELELDDGRGLYDVGVQTITISDTSGRDRDLTVDVWFPLAADSAGAAHQYTLLPGVFYESPLAFSATPDSISGDGPFPLVIYSHGSGGLRYIHSDYTEALASNGYIVAAADHTGNTAADDLLGTRDEGATIALNRPQDVTVLIDAMLNPESTETLGFVANVDPSKIAVTGHSFGGFTSYAVASGFDNELGEYVADERVGALITLAPATSETLLSDERLASIDIPTLVIGGTRDTTTPIEPNVVRPWELSSSAPSYRVDMIDAAHQTYTDVCAYQEFLPTLENVPEPVTGLIDQFAEQGCSAADMEIGRAQAITNTFATTFLDSVFRGTDPIQLEEVDEQADLIYSVK